MSRLRRKEGLYIVYIVVMLMPLLLPTALVFLYGQEFMVEGIQLSGVK